MSTFEITGGTTLKGELHPQGAKNEALQILCATLLTPEKVRIHNIPNILDVNRLIELLASLGVSVTQEAKNTYCFEAKEINLEYLNSDEFAKGFFS